jgi:hypothetical protein
MIFAFEISSLSLYSYTFDFIMSSSQSIGQYFKPFMSSGTYIHPTYKESFLVRWDNSIPLFSMLPSTLKYLYSVEPVRMHFPTKKKKKNDTVYNATYSFAHYHLYTAEIMFVAPRSLRHFGPERWDHCVFLKILGTWLSSDVMLHTRRMETSS